MDLFTFTNQEGGNAQVQTEQIKYFQHAHTRACVRGERETSRLAQVATCLTCISYMHCSSLKDLLCFSQFLQPNAGIVTKTMTSSPFQCTIIHSLISLDDMHVMQLH
jgi:hypothetical protein